MTAEANAALSIAAAVDLLTEEPSATSTTGPAGEAVTDEADAQQESGADAEPSDAEGAEEATGGDDGDAGDDDGDAEADKPAAEPVHRVKVNGEEVEVPLSELLRGYSRQADYTRSKQALAEERKAFQAEAEQTRAARQQYADALGIVEQLLQGPKEPDWEALKASDPVGYLTAREEWRARQDRLTAVRAQRAAEVQRLQAEQQEAHKRTVAEASERLLDMIPEWRDEQTRTTEKRAIKAFAAEVLGLSAEEVGSIVDPRAVVGLRMALQYHQLMTSKREIAAKKVATAAPVVRPQAAPTTAASAERVRKQALQRLDREGSIDAAVEALLAMRK